MVSKVNFKAKIQRHSRVFKHNILNIHPIKKIYNRFWINSLFFIVVFLFPIYPLFSNFIYWDSIYRWYIDENSIIDSYTEKQDNFWGDSVLVSSPDSFISVNDITDSLIVKENKPKNDTIAKNDNKDNQKTEIKKDETRKDIITYTVKSWDSLSKIASNHWVSNNSILWANNLSEKSVLKPWQKIKIPPVSWVVYEIKTGDTIWAIALKYNIDTKKILIQNGIINPSNVRIWQVIIIPWATQIKKLENKKIVSKNTSWYNFTKEANSSFTSEEWNYDLVKRKPQWRFAPWNCTWFVAQYKNVTWSWNAKNWLANARNKWVATWTEPSLWAIVVFNWRGYNPYYWHVWIVTWISWENLIIKDMNYRWLYEVTTRKVPINDRTIMWYIYID